jgi:hypothetical protein
MSFLIVERVEGDEEVEYNHLNRLNSEALNLQNPNRVIRDL